VVHQYRRLTGSIPWTWNSVKYHLKVLGLASKACWPGNSPKTSLKYQAVRVIIFTFVQWHATWEEKFPRIFWFLLPWAVRIPSSGSIDLVPRNCPILDWGGSKTSLIFHGGQRIAWISVSMHTGVFWHEKINGDVYKVERWFWMAVYQKIFTIFARPVSPFARMHFFYREMKSA